MAVNYTHPCYNHIIKKWGLVRAIVNNDALNFIRTVDENDSKRSNQYKQDAILTNFTRLTAIGLTGLVFRKPSLMTLPYELTYLEEDCTGYDFGLEQLAQQVVMEVLKTGRYGLLVDAPLNGGQARIKPYSAETIINWRYEEYESKYKLSLIVLKECKEVIDEDGFGSTREDQYRALRLIDNVYIQEIYNNDCEYIGSYVPVDYNGNTFDTIPFSFVGSENNDGWVDSIPLYDLAVLNLGHYRNSADVEETSFVSGQLVPVINVGESSAEEFKQANPNGIVVGSRDGIVVPAGGDFNFKQGAPNILPRELMADKQEQAAAIGARLIAPPGGRETAEAARIRSGSQNSALYTITKNVGLAFEMALDWLSLIMMEEMQPSTFTLNDQFYEEVADPNLIASLIMGFDRGSIKVNELRDNYRNMGIKLDSDDNNLVVNPSIGVDNKVINNAQSAGVINE